MRRLGLLLLAILGGCHPPSTLRLTEHGVLLPQSSRYSPFVEGVRVRVITCSGKEMEGTWLVMGYRHVVLRTRRGDRKIPWEAIARIHVEDDNDRNLAIPVVHTLSPFRAMLIGLVLSAPFLDFQDPLIAWVGAPAYVGFLVYLGYVMWISRDYRGNDRDWVVRDACVPPREKAKKRKKEPPARTPEMSPGPFDPGEF